MTIATLVYAIYHTLEIIDGILIFVLQLISHFKRIKLTECNNHFNIKPSTLIPINIIFKSISIVLPADSELEAIDTKSLHKFSQNLLACSKSLALSFS